MESQEEGPLQEVQWSFWGEIAGNGHWMSQKRDFVQFLCEVQDSVKPPRHISHQQHIGYHHQHTGCDQHIGYHHQHTGCDQHIGYHRMHV